MKTNFKIVSFTEIALEGIVYDLHNDFDFILNNLKIDEANILIHFKKSTSDWVGKEAPENIYFLVNDYHYLKTKEPNPNYLDDDHCLAGITFFDAGLRAEDESLIERENPNANDDLIFTFESERMIRVSCKSVTVEVD